MDAIAEKTNFVERSSSKCEIVMVIVQSHSNYINTFDKTTMTLFPDVNQLLLQTNKNVICFSV